MCRRWALIQTNEKKITDHVYEYTCACCGAKATTDSYGKLIPLTNKQKEINQTLHEIFVKRSSRSRAKGGIVTI